MKSINESKYIFSCLIVIFLSTSGIAKSDFPTKNSSKATKFKFLTFNILRTGNLQEKARKISTKLKSSKEDLPGIIVLQEIKVKKKDDIKDRPDKIIAKELGGYYSEFTSKEGKNLRRRICHYKQI